MAQENDTTTDEPLSIWERICILTEVAKPEVFTGINSITVQQRVNFQLAERIVQLEDRLAALEELNRMIRRTEAFVGYKDASEFDNRRRAAREIYEEELSNIEREEHDGAS